MIDRGYLAIVLHAHLPFVRHPEHEDFLEEDWLFEAITETYVPVLGALFRLRDQEVPFRLTMSVTAPLAAMLDDALLGDRYRRYLDRLTDLAARERARHGPETPLGRIAAHYVERFAAVRAFLDRWQWQILGAVRDLQASGALEVLACNGTHGLLPLMSGAPARRAQIRAGVEAYARSFGRRPRGIWLAECGYDHGVDALLAEEAIRYFFVDAHALEMGRPAPRRGILAPVYTPAGPAAFARDRETSRQVWSSHEGYPGDPLYREFYRDLGWDADYEYIRPYLHRDGVRRGVGYKCHRVTGGVALDGKQLYDPAAAAMRAREHARSFVADRVRQVREAGARLDRPPAIVSMYDAELFGHWWYEGPLFLEEVLRAAAFEPSLSTITPAEYLDRHGAGVEVQRPNPSTWGAAGSARVWLGPANAWMYRYQHWAELQMQALSRRFGTAGGLARRALAQAGRELMLLQSSDWAFILTTGTTPPYAVRRFKQHFAGFSELRARLLAGDLAEADIAAREARTPIFPDVDVTAWG